MQNQSAFLIVSLITVVGAFALGYLVNHLRSTARMKSLGEEAEELLAQAKTKYKEAELEARDFAIRIRNQAEEEARRQRQEIRQQERRLHKRQELLDSKLDALESRERKLDNRQEQLERQKSRLDRAAEEHRKELERAAQERRKELERTAEKRRKELERIAELSSEEAKKLLLKDVENEVRQDMARIIREVEAEAHEEADRRAREIITIAIQRLASDQVSETTVSSVPLPNDEMKGRIIGRRGRNIRAIEKVTGVDLVVDDTPEAVTISSFDPVRREVARVALGRLILDGRIHPARIEQVVQKARQEVEAAIREEGERAAHDLGIHGLHPDLIKLLGQLKHRTSYGQNVLQHSLETANLAAIMAAELGADVNLAKEAGLLHDIGKAIDHEVEGPHAIIGGDLVRRYSKNARLANAVAAHHAEEEPQSVEAILVQAADAISGARPGARRETLEIYLKRIKALEEVASSFPGVDESYAIQAGREIRIIVKPDEIDDAGSVQLSRNIAKKVEESLEYPGQIKVTVIREKRTVDYAK